MLCMQVSASVKWYSDIWYMFPYSTGRPRSH